MMGGGTVGEVVESHNPASSRAIRWSAWAAGRNIRSATAATSGRRWNRNSAPGLSRAGRHARRHRLVRAQQDHRAQAGRDDRRLGGDSGAVGSSSANSRGSRARGRWASPAAAEKCAYVRDELGFDACVDHKSPRFRRRLRRRCPTESTDCSRTSAASRSCNALRRLNDFARIAICGLIASYEAAPTVLPTCGCSWSGASRSKASSCPTICRYGRRRSANSPDMSRRGGSATARHLEGIEARRRRSSTCCTAAISARCW